MIINENEKVLEIPVDLEAETLPYTSMTLSI